MSEGPPPPTPPAPAAAEDPTAGARSGPALVIDALEKSYGSVHATRDVGLRADRGRVTALLGPNGAGKTTTIACATGLERPDGGTVRVFGKDPWRADAAFRSRIGVMIQDGGLASGSRSLALLRYAASLYRDPLDVEEVAEHLGITEFAGTLVRRLSGGQRQRLALALAIIGRPELVFLDEPTAGMDPAVRRSVRHLLRSLARTGTAVVLTTHLLDDVMGVADHVVVLSHGRVIATGSPEEIIARHRAKDGTVHLTAQAAGLDQGVAAALAEDLRRTAARHGVDLTVSTGAADLESAVLGLTENAPAIDVVPVDATARSGHEEDR